LRGKVHLGDLRRAMDEKRLRGRGEVVRALLAKNGRK
jgi:hypothetical protein